MPYNYAKLIGRIVEKVGTQGNFANEMGLSERTMHTAVTSGSWCGGQRQQCGDSGSDLI